MVVLSPLVELRKFEDRNRGTGRRRAENLAVIVEVRGEARSAELDRSGEDTVVRRSSGDVVATAVGELLRESSGGSCEFHGSHNGGEVLLLLAYVCFL